MKERESVLFTTTVLMFRCEWKKSDADISTFCIHNSYLKQ
jgi:hypothetical protein